MKSTLRFAFDQLDKTVSLAMAGVVTLALSIGMASDAPIQATAAGL